MNKKVLICGDDGKIKEFARLIAKCNSSVIIPIEEHDSDLLDKVAEKIKAQFKDMQFHTGRAWFDFDAGIDRCSEKVDKVIEEMKAEMQKGGRINEM